jgi:DeoR/GlpR family transcriptional regulator of sugar metabolism
VASLDEFAREQAILTELNASGRVVVNDLSRLFGVSAVTVRKDLDGLERRSLLRRVRGGAVGVGSGDEGAFQMRLRYARHAKQAIARTVAPLVRHGDVIAVDSSTTSYYLAHQLLNRRDLVVVTNGLRVATLLMEQSSATVLMPGGVLRRASGSMVGPIGDVLSGRGRIDKGFFGAIGVSTGLGLLDLSSEEAATKHFLAQACEHVYGLFDSSKVDGFGLHSFCAVDDIDAMFTDDGIAESVVAEWAVLGVPVHVVSAHGSDFDDDESGADVIDLDIAGRR